MSRNRLFAATAVLALATLTGSCDCGSGSVTGDDPASGDARVPAPDSDYILVPPPDTGSSRGCTTSSECAGETCFAGICCHAAAAVCGSVCCAAGTTCLFNQCVTPGKACYTAAECGSDEYCETALGIGPAPGDPVDAGLCTQPPPQTGRCLARPAVCSPGVDAACVRACEYRPDPEAALDAVPRWSWGPVAETFPDYTDIWSTPVVGRLFDSNCDGKVDELDPPNVVFVSGNAAGTCCGCLKAADGGVLVPSTCHTGVLRALDGQSGRELWSLDKLPGSNGFMGLSLAIGDLLPDPAEPRMEIAAITAEGFLVLVSGSGELLKKSDLPIPNAEATSSFGWGGGLAIADMNGDGKPEIAFGPHVFSLETGDLLLKFTGRGGTGGSSALSTFADIDGDGLSELVVGKAAFHWPDGAVVWVRTDRPIPAADGGVGKVFPEGFPAVADLDQDGEPEVVVVAAGHVFILRGSDGSNAVAPLLLEGADVTGGGPPTVADFDGDGKPEIGVAQELVYFVLKPTVPAPGQISGVRVLYRKPNHDLSSSVTGSTVFDFEGDGRAEVIYGDECFLWVFDGEKGGVRFATSRTSFTATEASLVADVDGDGRAEIVLVSNGASPSGWKCLDAQGVPVEVDGVTWQPGPTASKAYRGITVFGDRAKGWVGTRALWNQHTYHVTGICDDRDSACPASSHYGQIPSHEPKSWSKPWTNNFRQNVQDEGVFDAPDPTVSVSAECSDPLRITVAVRNAGQASRPAGVAVAVFVEEAGGTRQIATTSTTRALLPSQTELLIVELEAGSGDLAFHAKIINDPAHPTFHECRTGNNRSETIVAPCPE
ncbi:MAG: VCBS repeat-containing protein [Deltaproteobacteria bacterium]|nr:VCBS repeat-containing protein [Deltaproteobacteria bacterium]